MWGPVWLAALCVGAFTAPANAAELLRTETSAPVDATELSMALSRGTVIARLDQGEVLASMAGEVSALEPASLYLAASSEFMSVAVVRGSIMLDGQAGQTGDVFVRSIAGSRLERFAFDTSAFRAATPTAALTAEDIASLDAVQAEQERRIYWGGLERTGFDAQAPSGDPMMEAVRRDYLLRPAVMEVRAAAQGDPERLGREAADRFVSGLAARDTAAVEALLSPTLFTDGDRRQVEWLNDRSNFARDLVAGDMPTTLSGAALGEGSLADGYAVDVRGTPWRVRLQPLDTMVFVTALEPVPAEPEKKL